MDSGQPAAVNPDDAQRALESAQERYTAARRKYTAMYVDSQSPADQTAPEALEAARKEALDLAATLRLVEDGDPEAIRRELASDPVTDDERARTTNRFTLAELRQAAAESAPAASWDWKA